MILTNLIADVRFKATGDSSNTSYGETDIKRNLNKYFHYLNSIAIRAGALSLAFGEIVDINTVAGQNEYLLTDTDINLRKTNLVWQKTSSAKNYQQSKAISFKKVDDPDNYSPGRPEHVFLEDSLWIYTPETTIQEVEAGIKVLCQTDFTELSADDDVPQMPDFIQEYAICGATAEYCDAKNNYSKADRYRARMEKLEPKVEEYYYDRADIKINISVQKESFSDKEGGFFNGVTIN